MKRFIGLLFLLGLAMAAPPGQAAPALQETPLFAKDVAAGKLPPVAERVPEDPLVVDLAARGRSIGTQGGTLRTFITRPRDVRYMVVWGYARLVAYDDKYDLHPDLLRAVDNEDDRIYTFHLRRGHRWSDGAPFTTEDFRYFWEDVALNPDLSPGGPPEVMLVDGKPPKVTVIDEVTIRYEWDTPNPRFLPALAAARPPFIYRPAHYLSQFHAKYVDPATLEPLMAERKARNWAQLHNGLDNLYNNDNPDEPTLQPWVTVSAMNSQGYELTRNPYYHRIDAEGHQLPYIDHVELTIAAAGLIPQKVTLGEADLQVRSISFSDAPVLKQGEGRGKYHTWLWSTGYGSDIALYPNQNYNDPALRELFRTADFRRALSLGVRRTTINKTLYFGLAKEANVAPLRGSPFYDPALSAAWADHDAERANAMLDALGLGKRDGDGTRLLPDGKRLEIVIESAGERPEEADAIELLAEMWAEIGVKVIYRPLDRDILRNKVYSGQSMMPVWYGWNNGLPTPEAPPVDLAPVEQTNFSWPEWGQYTQSNGLAGEPPQTDVAKRLLELFHDWERTSQDKRRREIWEEMLRIQADEVFAIGLVSAAPQPAIVADTLRNVPEQAIYAWEPGAQLGVLRMDEFWFAP
ncbi:ABC transporter substrate-binding protein [Paroceanicella profunda]|uniref:ABC transporter substrate-binding protein n=1 Tax=Paroceanicella profunda TaxID=2579971 RepID=A0A5B8FGU2_9RHOB|nr:ABC transporter substrate-binding protein [Paroceanicella profunda]QDL91397.1 ABC transporter substrate-binding protein [Paroceanicella profunda]